MLNEMRFGTLTSESIQTFKQLSRAIEYDDGIGPTELYVMFPAYTKTQPLTDIPDSLAAKTSSGQTPPGCPA